MTQEYPTSLGTSDADTITLLGQNLADDLMGKVGFGELTLWMVTQRRPTQSEVRVFESVLVALADHGFTPTAIAARITYLSAPDSVACAANWLRNITSRARGILPCCRWVSIWTASPGRLAKLGCSGRPEDFLPMPR